MDRPPDASRPASLADMAAAAGLGAADVAVICDLEESTVSRLWSDPRWLDRVTGGTLQRIIAAVPGVAEYVACQPVAERMSGLAAGLAEAGLSVDHAGLRAAIAGGVPATHLANALEAGLHTIRGDHLKAAAHLARLWGREPDQAAARLFSAGPDKILADPGPLIRASEELAPQLRRTGYSMHKMLAEAAIVHHAQVEVAVPPGDSRVRGRQEALSLRSEVMGRLITGNDEFDAAERYARMVEQTPMLVRVEEWSLPTYAHDVQPRADFSLPRSILLRRTAGEVIREIDGYPDAYVFYLLSVFIPLALSRDPTFGMAVRDLRAAIRNRLGKGGDTRLTSACEQTLRHLEGLANDD